MLPATFDTLAAARNLEAASVARAVSRYVESWPEGQSRQSMPRAWKLGSRASRPPLQAHRQSLKML